MDGSRDGNRLAAIEIQFAAAIVARTDMQRQPHHGVGAGYRRVGALPELDQPDREAPPLGCTLSSTDIQAGLPNAPDRVKSGSGTIVLDVRIGSNADTRGKGCYVNRRFESPPAVG